MALWRVQIALGAADRAKLETEKVEINSRLDARLFDKPRDWTEWRDRIKKTPIFIWQGRFKNKAGSDNLKAFLDSKVAEWKSAAISGTTSLHLCTHDEPSPIDCSTSQYSEIEF